MAMEACRCDENESDEHVAQDLDQHEYLEVIESPRRNIRAFSSRIYDHFDRISIRITRQKWKFILCFVLGCATSVCVITPFIILHVPLTVQIQEIYQGNCSSNWTCGENAYCAVFDGQFTCICQPGYAGKHCEIKDQCILSTPCLNNGTCIITRTASYCTCKDGFLGNNCQHRGPKGNNFVLLFNPSKRNITLYMASDKSGECNIVIPSLKRYKTLFLKGSYISYELAGGKNLNNKRIKGDLQIRVVCDVAITLYYFVYDKHDVIWETFLVYPSAVLAKEYIIPQYNARQKYDAIGIITFEDDTEITVHFSSARWILSDIIYNKKHYAHNTKALSILSNAHEYNSLSCDECYLTGTYVSGSRPFALFFKSYLPEVIPVIPLKDFSKLFIVPRFSGGISSSGLRMFSAIETDIEFKDVNGTISTSHLHANGNLKKNHQGPVIVSSKENICLFLKMEGPQTGTLDTLVPGITQYLPYYEFIVPRDTANNFAIIVVKSAFLPGIRLDMKRLETSELTETNTIQMFGELYSVAAVAVDNGWHFIDHTQQVPFAVLVHGITNPKDKRYSSPYFYFAGMKFDT